MLTDNDIKKLISNMQGVFASSQDHVSLEQKVDEVTALIGQLPTTTDIEHIINNALIASIYTQEHMKIKRVLRERLNVEI